MNKCAGVEKGRGAKGGGVGGRAGGEGVSKYESVNIEESTK